MIFWLIWYNKPCKLEGWNWGMYKKANHWVLMKQNEV